MHYGPEQKKNTEKIAIHSLSHKRGSKQSEWASEWVSAAERTSKASRVEQAQQVSSASERENRRASG